MDIFTDTLEMLLKHSSAEKAESQKRFFKTGPGDYGYGDEFIGISMPEIRSVAKSAYEKMGYGDLSVLISDSRHEVRMLALIILVMKYEKAGGRHGKNSRHTVCGNAGYRNSVSIDNPEDTAEMEKKKIVEFYFSNIRYINNWDLVDQSAYKIAGDYYISRNKEIFHRMSETGTLWEKRISAVAAIAWVRKGMTEDFLEIAERLMDSKEDLLQKATGWGLREMGKTDQEKLISFLEKNRYRMGSTAYSYATEHLKKYGNRNCRWKRTPEHLK